MFIFLIFRYLKSDLQNCSQASTTTHHPLQTRGLCPPPTRDCPCCWLAGPGVDFKYGSTPCAELQNADLSNMNLEGT